ncbi:ABC transporter substrate-binding protein [Orrella sp. JC864]|uniref:ABC transporter substrate-binding protein n=1 Tax=Orrella sp. JC864 TaxID=3120298 RepID=UPI00300A11A5
MEMKQKLIRAAAALAATGALGAALPALAAEQFIPLLAYRTGSFAPLGIPWADGKMDYLKLVNARDGGINGVKITYEECETAYATDRGVECYERLKTRGGGASGFDTQSTGITFAVTDKAPLDKVPVVTPGYGLSQSADGSVFEWNFPLGGTYWTAADVMIQDIARKEGGFDNLKGKKIALVYHDSPYGKEPIPLLQARAKKHGFELLMYPVTAPGVEQKSTWLQIRQSRPAYVLLWSAGIMTPTAIREAQASGYPRDKMYAIWWAGSEGDVRDLGAVAKGYNAITIHNSASRDKVHEDLKTHVYDKGQGTGPSSVGTIAHTRGMIISMLQVEGIRAAQEKFGKGKPMTPEQVRWGLENLNLTQERLNELGFGEIMRPIQTSCRDHMGGDWARIVQWDGARFEVVSDWYQSDKELIDPMVKELAARYAKEKGTTPRDC